MEDPDPDGGRPRARPSDRSARVPGAQPAGPAPASRDPRTGGRRTTLGHAGNDAGPHMAGPRAGAVAGPTPRGHRPIAPGAVLTRRSRVGPRPRTGAPRWRASAGGAQGGRPAGGL